MHIFLQHLKKTPGKLNNFISPEPMVLKAKKIFFLFCFQWMSTKNYIRDIISTFSIKWKLSIDVIIDYQRRLRRQVTNLGVTRTLVQLQPKRLEKYLYKLIFAYYHLVYKKNNHLKRLENIARA